MYDPMTFEYNIEYFNNFLDDFKDYQTIVEEKLLEDSTEKFHKYQSKLDGEIDLKSKADIVNSKEEFFEFLDNNYNNIIDRYSKIEEFRKQIAFYSYSFRSSLLVQIFSVFEHELIKICDEFHKKNHTNFKLKDLKGNNDVDKAKVFLQKTCKVNFLDLEVEWRYINTIRKIRNKIIHHQSSISTVDNEWKELSDFIFKNNDKIGFDEYVNIMTKEEIDEKYGVGGYLEFHIKNENLNLEFIEIIKRFYRKLLIQIGVNQ